jgi:hypothetical protein
MVAATAVTGILFAISVPVIDDARRAAELSRATAQVHGLLVRCRATAVLRGANCSVVFDRDGQGGWCCVVAEDGDGDGVRRSDIRAGVDPVVGRELRIAAGSAGPGILSDEVPDPSGSGLLGGNLSDPIRAGAGDIISFSARGTATPSSVFFTDHSRRMIVLRIYGGTARINRLSWRRGSQTWTQG